MFNTTEGIIVKDFSFLYWSFFDLIDKTRVNSGNKSMGRKGGVYSALTSGSMVTTVNHSEQAVLESLKKLYQNHKAGFTGVEQKEGVFAILNDIKVLTFVNKTGSGKSLLYFIPAFIDKQTVNLILTPRVSLREDLFKKAKALRLNPILLEQKPNSRSNLVFCNLEHLNSKALDQTLESYRRYGYKVRIFLDEVRLFMLEENFRADLKNLNTILKYNVGLVFISATLPLSLEKLLLSRLNVTGSNFTLRGPKVRCLRHISRTRPSVKYTEYPSAITRALATVFLGGRGGKVLNPN